MKKRIFTLMTAALLMAGSVVNVAYAAVGDITATAGTTATKLEGTKFYLGTADDALFPIETIKGSDYVTIGTDGAVDAKTAVFEVRNLKAVDATSVSFELWTAGKQLGVLVDGSAFDENAEADEIFTSFVATYDDKDKVGTLEIENIYVNKFGATAISNWNFFTASKEQDAAFLQEYNNKGITFGFDGKNVIGNAFGETLQVVKVVKGALDNTSGSEVPDADGFVLAKGTKDDMDAFVTAAGTAEGGIAEAAEKVSILAITDKSAYQINGAATGEAAVIEVLGTGKFIPTAVNIEKVLFTAVSQSDYLTNPDAILLTMGNYYVGGVQPDGKGDNVYVTTVSASSSALTVNPAILGESTYLDASVLLKEDAVNTVNIYFTSGKQSIEGDVKKQYEYHKYLVAGVGTAYQLEARAKSEIDLTSPMTQWVVSGFDGKATFTLTNREAELDASQAGLELKLKATAKDGEYMIVGGKYKNVALVEAGADIAEGVTKNADIAKNQALIGKVVRFNSVATTKTDGFLEMTKAEREGGFHLLFSGKVPGGVAEMYGVLSDNESADSYLPAEDKGDYAFTAEVVKGGSLVVANYIINEVDAAYLDKEGNIVTIKDTLAVPSYKLYAGTDGSDKFYLTADANVTATTAGEFFFRKNYDGTYAMGVTATAGTGVYGTDITAAAKAVSVNADGDDFETTTATLYNSEAISNVTIEFNDNSDATSLPAVPRHVSFDNALGSVNMQLNKNNLQEGILSTEGLIFWLDTVGKADLPKFYISRGVEGQAERLFMFNSKDSLGLFSEDDAQQSKNKNYLLEGTANTPKAIFRSASLIAKDTLTTTIDGEATKLYGDDLSAYQYTIQLNNEDVDNEYVVKSMKDGWLYALNGKLGFTNNRPEAMVFTLGDEEATANEATPSVSEVKVIAAEGAIRIAGAQGKKVVISNILGQVIANTVISSSDATIAAPAGIVVVAVEGEEAVKAIVK